MQLLISDIEIGPRLRSIRESNVDTLARSFQTEGQLQPVVVRRDGPQPRLVAGAHRIEAAKRAGWTHIEAREIKLDGMSPAMADVTCAIAEVDENMSRGDLDQAERVTFVDERVLLTARRRTLRKLEADQKAHAEANTKSERDAAAKRTARAAAAAKKVAPGKCPAGNQPGADGRLPNDVIDEVAAELGLSKQTIRHARSFAHQIGRDNLAVMAGTSIGTKAEMTAFIRLNKLDAKVAADCIKKVTYAKSKGIGAKRQEGNAVAMGFSPSGRLGVILKQDKATQHHEALKSSEGRLKHAHERAQQIAKLYTEWNFYWHKLPVEIQSKVPVVQLLHDAQDRVRLMRDLAKPVVQKRTGTEHRYVTEKKGPSKDEVRASLGKGKPVKGKVVVPGKKKSA